MSRNGCTAYLSSIPSLEFHVISRTTGTVRHFCAERPAIIDHIRREPDHEAYWLALAAHLHDNSRDDETAVVRVYWRTIRDSIGTRMTLDEALAMVGRHAGLLGRAAREAEERTILLTICPCR